MENREIVLLLEQLNADAMAARCAIAALIAAHPEPMKVRELLHISMDASADTLSPQYAMRLGQALQPYDAAIRAAVDARLPHGQRSRD